MSDAEIVRPFVRVSFDYYQFNKITPADGPRGSQGEETSSDNSFSLGPFLPSQGGGFDFSAVTGESRYHLKDFFGYHGSAGAGLFLSRYAPERIVTDFTLDANGRANGLVETPNAGGVTYLGATVPLRGMAGFRLFGVIPNFPLYLMGQMELEPRGGAVLNNSLQHPPTQGERWVSEMLIKPGLALLYPISLYDHRDLILSGGVNFFRWSFNSLAGYSSAGAPNFSLSLGYYFDSQKTIEEKYYETHRRPEESELDYLRRRCSYGYSYDRRPDKNLCEKYIPLLCAEDPQDSDCIEHYKTHRKPEESQSLFNQRTCVESGNCISHLTDLQKQCEENPEGKACEDYRSLFNKVHGIKTQDPKIPTTPEAVPEGR